MKSTIVSLEDLEKVGNWNAKWHVNNAQGKKPYVIVGDELRDAKPEEFHKGYVKWLTDEAKIRYEKNLKELAEIKNNIEALEDG